MSRSASSSCKGYIYQPARGLNLAFCKYAKDVNNLDESSLETLDNIFIQLEKEEDVDFYTVINGDETKDLYQLKYLNTDDKESLTKTSGLVKVLISHFDETNIGNIFYEVVSTNKIEFSKRIIYYQKMLADKKNMKLIGKYFVLLFCDKKFTNMIDHSNKNYSDIVKYIKCNKKHYDNMISEFNNKIHETNIETNEIRLKSFVNYCHADENTNNLIVYLNKIHLDINKNTFDKIHKETVKKIKILLPCFDPIYQIMSQTYSEFASESLYGMFEMILKKNLFRTNEKLSIKQIIWEVKCRMENIKNENDIANIFIYTVKYFVRESKFHVLRKKHIDEELSNCLLINKITITQLIKMLNEQHIGDLLRDIVHCITTKIDYKIVHDNGLVSFLHRIDTLELTGNYYKTLENIDRAILEFITPDDNL